MRSVADDVRREQRERISRLTPAERVGLAEKLGAEGLAALMAAQGLDRAGALAAVRRTRRIGRRASRCHDEGR